jgi:hypothetical protein
MWSDCWCCCCQQPTKKFAHLVTRRMYSADLIYCNLYGCSH